MNEDVLHIKNMVCPRCIMVVSNILKETGIEATKIILGQVFLAYPITQEQQIELKQKLSAVGFELMEDKRIQLVERIKNILIELVHQSNSDLKINLSDYLMEKIPLHTYHQLSSLFSDTEHTTIEKYFITQKIERVKELLTYDELSLNQIADQLNYSSVAHLSTQFKKITGYTPSQFKKLSGETRKPLDRI